MDVHHALQIARQEAVQAVDLKFIDLFGALHHITLPANLLSQRFFETGVGFDGSSVPGLSMTGGSDLQLIPDPSTAWIDPFWDVKTLSFLGRICKTGTLEPSPFDSREIIRKSEAFLRSTGVATEGLWGPEFEFYIFDSVTYENNGRSASYRILSSEAEWSSELQNGGSSSLKIGHQAGYHVAPPKDRYYNLRQKMTDVAIQAGIPVKYHHHEVGAPGQTEIEIVSDTMAATADRAILLKYICKMVAHTAGRCVTFMPKPLHGEAGNGMHFHQQLMKDGEPVFYHAEGYAGLSQTALNYIGGLLKHGPALLGLTNPSTNSYKRLVPGFEAPIKSIFGLGNRSAAIRIPKYATDPMEKRMEFRPPDATCNIHLAMTAQLMAGLDGILNRIDPTEAGFGPFDVDIETLSPAERDKIPTLPTSLTTALQALQDDHEFLLQGGVFSKELIARWIDYKLENEEKPVSQRPHPYEMKLYFDV